jgi:hypothetical protein
MKVESSSEPGECKPVGNTISNPPESASDKLAGCSRYHKQRFDINRVSGVVP